MFEILIRRLRFQASGTRQPDALRRDEEAAGRMNQTERKVLLRIVPFTFLIYVISFLDRANLSFAALGMSSELGIRSEAYGFAAGIFFIGYALCEVPSNIALRRFGPRIWLARIQLTWGVVACATAFVHSTNQLIAARFLLGVAEGGLVPGLIAYYNLWFVYRRLATTGALLASAGSVAYVISGPVSTWIMAHVSIGSLSGWRSMIIAEGIPAILTGIATLFLLSDHPGDAKWLKPDERQWLIAELDKEDRGAAGLADLSLLSILLNPTVIVLCVIYVLCQIGSFGVSFWLPQTIAQFSKSLTLTDVGMFSAIPYAIATVGMYIWSRSSDRFRERRRHAAVALFLASVGLVGTALSTDLKVSLVLLSLVLTGFFSFKSPFNVLPRLFMTRRTSVIAFAVINTIGQIGAFLGPYIVGVVKAHTEGHLPSFLVLAACTLMASILIWGLKVDRNKSNTDTL